VGAFVDKNATASPSRVSATRQRQDGEAMTNELFDEDGEEISDAEDPEPLNREREDTASTDSEIDFDDEVDDEVGPIDVIEAGEAGALLDDPEELDEDE
jgi:hypothetical protein